MTVPRRTAVTIAPALLGALGTYLLVASTVVAPFVWAALIWIAIYIAEMRVARSDGARTLWLVLLTAAIVLGGYEAWLQIIKPEQGVWSDSYKHSGYIGPNDVLGYGPALHGPISSTLRFGDEIVYDVTYTIGEDGLRVTPDPGSADDRGCILFFGGSFTFGEGVEDDETLPARLAVATDGRLRMRNFGFHGYGPHQMLAAFESGMVERTAGCRPAYIIVQTALWHTQRVIGATVWDNSGPRYVLDDAGRCVLAGKFTDLDGAWSRPILDLLERSLVFTKKLAPLFDRKMRAVVPGDLDLLTAVIAAARDRAAVLYPSAEFHVLLWDMEPDDQAEPLRKLLRKRGLRIHSVRTILGADGTDPYDPSYSIDPRDSHPSPKAYDVLSRYIKEEIVGR